MQNENAKTGGESGAAEDVVPRYPPEPILERTLREFKMQNGEWQNRKRIGRR